MLDCRYFIDRKVLQKCDTISEVTKLIGTKVRGQRTAHKKRAAGVETNIHIVQAIKKVDNSISKFVYFLSSPKAGETNILAVI